MIELIEHINALVKRYEDDELHMVMTELMAYMNALHLACKQIADFCGTCPDDQCDWECPHPDTCDNDVEKCWEEYFLERGSEQA